jgi:coenzyme F420-reducing hydrogenase beta subunit
MINVYNKDSCVGCSACAVNCPHKAISMELSDEGFLYPKINSDLCCSCKLCDRVCPIDKKNTSISALKAYYGWHLDDEIRYRSSSGGFFSALADEILCQKGVVYGAIFKDNKFVYSNTDSVELDALRKSKYTEIDSLDVFSKVKNDVLKGRQVLFCGTPCRVAGLKLFLDRDYENLILIDFLCGGVASPKFLFEDFKYHEKRNQSTISHVDFRCKKGGWGGQHLMKLKFTNGKEKTLLAREDAYFTGFLTKLINRKSCYMCQFIDNHFSDITIGDFWDYTKVPGLSNDKKGMSMMVAHTEKGCIAIENLKNFRINSLDYSIVEGNFIRTGKYSEFLDKRNYFFKDALDNGFICASKEYMEPLTVLKHKIKYMIKKIIGK